MPVAQVIRLDERQAIARPPRKREPGPCVVLQLFRAPMRKSHARRARAMSHDDDRTAGRGRDPG
jgi:hypothetical protein